MHSEDRKKASASSHAKLAQSPKAASGQVLLKRPPPGLKRKAAASGQLAAPSSSSSSRLKIEPDAEAKPAPNFGNCLEKMADSKSKADLEAEAEAALEALASSVPLDLQTMADRAASADVALKAPASDVCVGPCRCPGPCVFGSRKSVNLQEERRVEHSLTSMQKAGIVVEASASPSWGDSAEKMVVSKSKAELEAEAEAALQALAFAVPLDLRTTAERAAMGTTFLETPGADSREWWTDREASHDHSEEEESEEEQRKED